MWLITWSDWGSFEQGSEGEKCGGCQIAKTGDAKVLLSERY